MTVKIKLRQMREELGLTIDQLSDRSGISKPHISLIENGKRMPSLDAMYSLCQGLGVSIHSVLEESIDFDDDLQTMINIFCALDSVNKKTLLRCASSRLTRGTHENHDNQEP